MRIVFLVVTSLFVVQSLTVKAQERYGAVLGNYSGVASLQVNPSAIHNSKTYLEVQLIGLEVFLQNNYLYIPKTEYRFMNFLDPGYEWPTHTEQYGTEERIFYHRDNLARKKAFFQTRIDGPGAMLLYKHHGFALTTAIRSVLSGRVPYEMANFMYLGLNYRPQQDIRYTDNVPVRAQQMTWAEIGLTYSNTFHAHGFDVFSAGITLKRLMGIEGLYVDTRQIEYIVPDDSTIDVRNLDAEMGIALPVDYSTNDIQSSPIFRGGGFSADLGITYIRLKKYHQYRNLQTLCAEPYEDYLFRVGVALVDFGGIRFNDNATRIRIDNRSALWEDVDDLPFTTINNFLDTLSYKFYGDTTSAYDGTTFTMWLPAALSIQVDYHLRKNLYVNASLIQGIPFSGAMINRPAQLAVTPRFETKYFEASLPVSLYDWSIPRIGAAVRLWFLTIGTDNLGGFFPVRDFTGLDFYFTLKFFFNKGSCREKGGENCGMRVPKKVRK